MWGGYGNHWLSNTRSEGPPQTYARIDKFYAKVIFINLSTTTFQNH